MGTRIKIVGCWKSRRWATPHRLYSAVRLNPRTLWIGFVGELLALACLIRMTGVYSREPVSKRTGFIKHIGHFFF